MPTINATVFPNEAYVLIEVDWLTRLFQDLFTRNTNPGWNTATTGQLWTSSGGAAADYFVNGTQGVISLASLGVSREQNAAVSIANVDYSGTFTNPVVPAGNVILLGFKARFVDNNNFVEGRITLSGASVTVDVRQVVGGVSTASASVIVPGLPPNGTMRWRLYANGSDLRFKVWSAASGEPAVWHASMVTTHLAAGVALNINTFPAPGLTNPLPILFTFDDVVAIDLDATQVQCAIVTRRNTVTGEVVQLRPYIFYDGDGALMLECGQGLWWDTEPPLNVPLEYCTMACPTPVALSANSGFEGGAVLPWVATGGVLTSSSTFAHAGTSSGLLTPTGGVSNPSFAQSFTGVLAGVPLTFSAWVMSPQGWNGVMLRMSLLYTNGITEVFDTPIEILDDNEWRFLTSTITPDLNATATFTFMTMGAPPNTTLFYVDEIQATQPVQSALTACETVTVESDSVWLKSPLHPCLDIEIGLCNPMLEDCEEDSRVSYAGTSTQSYAPNTVALAPVNRLRIIPVNRIRRDASSVLRLIAHDCAAKDSVLAINAPGDPLLFQAPVEYCIPDRYITVGVEDEDHLSVDQREQFRLMTLPYETVDRPQGPADGICGARIADLCDIYASWGALTIAGFTWTDLLLGAASPNGPGQPEPPGAARTWDMVEAEFTDWDDVEAGGTRDWDELRDGL